MYALDARTSMDGWEAPLLVKVAGLADFASGRWPVERMVLDLRETEVRNAAGTLSDLPWAGFLVPDPAIAPSGRPWVSAPSKGLPIGPGDVIEVRPEIQKVALRYRRGGNNNILFATERCNSFCVMCSQPPRSVADDWRVEQLCELVDLIDQDTRSITVTGGEPTLLGGGLIRVIEHCARTLPATHVQVLSNGRAFGDGMPASGFRGIHPSLIWAVPLYGDHFGLHDYIVQSAGAFAQTLRGLYALEAAEQRIEVRVVLVKPVVGRLSQLVRFIYRNLPFVEHVALMGIEPTGFAKAHRDELWIDPVDMQDTLAHALDFLARRGIEVSLYNLPLCTLPRSLWPFAKRSISDWKQRYLSECEGCQVKDQCGGLFAWVTPEWTSRSIRPLLEGVRNA